MRTLICRFSDELDFFHNLRTHQGAGGVPTFSLLGGFEVQPGETVEVVAIVASARQRCKLRVEVTDRRVVAVDTDRPSESQARRFSYRCIVCPEDRVWLEMFVKKLRTLQRVQPDRCVG